MRIENHQQMLENILNNNKMLDAASVKQVLILHEEELTNIGDWVIRFDKLKYLKGYLQNAAISINFTAESELLGDELMEKFIFSKGLSLRQAICLLASSHTRLVFGPYTGLMHCASGIYNNYVSNGLDKAQTPVLITYTGKYLPDEGHVYLWWNNAPLVNVLVLRNRNNSKTMLLMDDLNDVERVTNDGLECAEYTARMLAEFVNQKH